MNYSEIKTEITLKDLLAITKNYYKKKYSKYENVKVEFGLESDSYSSQDWGDWEVHTSYFYSLSINITYDKKIKDLILKGKDKIKYNNVEKEVINILNENYPDDEYYVSNVIIPNYKTQEINYDYEITIYFEKKNKKIKKKLI